MKALRSRSAKAQQGSVYTTMILVALFAIVILAALKIVPAYIDDSAVNSTMEDIAAGEDFGTMSIADVRSALMKTMNTNRIPFDANNVVLVKDSGSEYVDVNYESRKPLFANIEAVVVFKHRYEKN